LKAGLEKDTAGAFDADTDSNEAIRDRMDTLIGTPVADVSTDIATVDAVVDEIPSETNAKTFNATALASIEAEATDAIEADDLDHLLQLDGATQKYPENCATDSIVAKTLAKGDPADPSTYDCTTDSQEALSDKLGGFSGDGGAAQDDSVKASMDLAHTDLDAILADTNELQTDWTNGGRLDLLIDAIKAVTDVLDGLADDKTQFTDPGDAGVATVTGAAGANTFGAYTQAIASTGQDQWLVGISTELDQADIYTIEVATGAAASETPIAEFKYEAQNADTSVTLNCFPIKVASGTRVAIRLKTVGGGSDTISNTDLIWRK
jgi:hypothetical protein